MAHMISPADLKTRIGRVTRNGESELALIDVREQGAFAGEHLFWACNIPLSVLDLRAPHLIPRKTAPVVLMDEGSSGFAERAAAVLADLGYTDIAILKGGTASWAAAGYELFSGVNLPSKAFGEFIVHTCGTPCLPADDIKALIDAGENMVILDSRPFPEYQRMNIPGGIDTPGAELALRVHDLAPDPETLVVVNCAGRTRSIIGAQSLINAGIPNNVVALKDGTMGWHLAGHGLEHGQDRRAPAPSKDGQTKARDVAERVRTRFGVRTISVDDLSELHNEDERTLLLLDVRSPEEFVAGHRPGSVMAPGGQLVQATDEYAGVLGARLVLIDDNGVRATMTASWLIQMGWNGVYVLEGGLAGPLETGPGHEAAAGQAPEGISAKDLHARLESGSVLALDLRRSLAYRDGHVPGAAWTTRSRLSDNRAEFATLECIALVAPDEAFAARAAADIAALAPKPEVRMLLGGIDAWIDAGLPVETGYTRTLSPTDDVWYKPYDHRDKGEEAVRQEMRKYLSWEVDLVAQIARDGDTNFRHFD